MGTDGPDGQDTNPDPMPDRRAVTLSALAAGFAMAVQPVIARTAILTGTDGLVAGEVTIPVADGTLPGYRAMPAGAGPFPTLLVVQEIFGVHEHIRDVCRRFAKQGYVAVAPSLYSRLGDPTRVPDIKTLMADYVSRTPDAQVMADLDATAAWAAASGKADPERLGVTGFCWGGRITWLYAAHNPKLKAGVAWYGHLIREPNPPFQPRHPIDLAAGLKAPVLGLYGGADEGIPGTTVERMRAALRKAGSSSEIVLYPDAPHGFFADYRSSYRPEPAKDAWARCLAWFERYGVA